jgi:hypothetical protein
MNDFNTAQKWLYDKIINNGQLSKDKIDSLKIYGWTQEVRDLFTNYNLSLDFKKEIGAFYSENLYKMWSGKKNRFIL